MKNHNHNKWDLFHLLFYHKLFYILLIILGLILSIGIIVVFFEQNAPNATITNFGDGIWWAFVTASAVGYGDHFPITFAGRTLAVILMVIGIALFSVITANIATFFVEEDEEKELAEIKQKIDSLEEKIDSLLKK